MNSCEFVLCSEGTFTEEGHGGEKSLRLEICRRSSKSYELISWDDECENISYVSVGILMILVICKSTPLILLIL